MSAYRDALRLDAGSSLERVNLAKELLKNGRGVVVLSDRLALRPAGSTILCEVIDCFVDSTRSPSEYRQMVEDAKLLLAGSPLAAEVLGHSVEWLVVADYGNGTIERWPSV